MFRFGTQQNTRGWRLGLSSGQDQTLRSTAASQTSSVLTTGKTAADSELTVRHQREQKMICVLAIMFWVLALILKKNQENKVTLCQCVFLQTKHVSLLALSNQLGTRTNSKTSTETKHAQNSQMILMSILYLFVLASPSWTNMTPTAALCYVGSYAALCFPQTVLVSEVVYLSFHDISNILLTDCEPCSPVPPHFHEQFPHLFMVWAWVSIQSSSSTISRKVFHPEPPDRALFHSSTVQTWWSVLYSVSPLLLLQSINHKLWGL